MLHSDVQLILHLSLREHNHPRTDFVLANALEIFLQILEIIFCIIWKYVSHILDGHIQISVRIIFSNCSSIRPTFNFLIKFRFLAKIYFLVYLRYRDMHDQLHQFELFGETCHLQVQPISYVPSLTTLLFVAGCLFELVKLWFIFF